MKKWWQFWNREPVNQRSDQSSITASSKSDVLTQIENYIEAQNRGDAGARDKLYEALDRISIQVPGELEQIEHDLQSGRLEVSNPVVTMTAVSTLRQVYGSKSRSEGELAEIEKECRTLISRQMAKLGLEKAALGRDPSTEKWLIEIVDAVAAELMPKYGLSRDEFLQIVRKVWD